MAKAALHDAFIYDAIRTPRGRAKESGGLQFIPYQDLPKSPDDE